MLIIMKRTNLGQLLGYEPAEAVRTSLKAFAECSSRDNTCSLRW